MALMEFVLLGTILVLMVVLLLETREYRKARIFIMGLDRMITTYTAGFNALATTVNSIESSFDKSSEEHQRLRDELIRHGSLLEIHNRALNLDPRLITTINCGEENIKIP